MKHLVFAIVTVTVLGVAWFFLSPLFIDEVVDEAFDPNLPDLALPDGSLNMAKVMSMPEDERMSMKTEIMETAAAAPDSASVEDMPTGGPALLASGEFVDADAIHKGSGRALLYAVPDGRHVLRFEDFRTTNGPALVVYLARHASPASAADVIDGGFLDLGKLKGNVGNQNYPIPADVDVTDYGSVVIWCELFDVLFSPAALELVETTS